MLLFSYTIVVIWSLAVARSKIVQKINNLTFCKLIGKKTPPLPSILNGLAKASFSLTFLQTLYLTKKGPRAYKLSTHARAADPPATTILIVLWTHAKYPATLKLYYVGTYIVRCTKLSISLYVHYNSSVIDRRTTRLDKGSSWLFYYETSETVRRFRKSNTRACKFTWLEDYETLKAMHNH